jgi:hypothetical protein
LTFNSQSTINRQQSAPQRTRNHGRSIHDSGGHQLNKQLSNVGTIFEEMEYTNVAAKTLDMDEIDKETLHLLVFLFMQFLSHPEQAKMPPQQDENKSSASGKNHPAHRHDHIITFRFCHANYSKCTQVLPMPVLPPGLQ